MTLRFLFTACLTTATLICASAMAGAPFDDARYAIGVKQNETALKLVDSGQIKVNMQTEEGYTLLHYAADAGNMEMVNALLERGADPTIRSKTGSTAYEMATGTTMKAMLAKAQAAWGGKNASISAAKAAPPVPQPRGTAASESNGMCAAVRAERVNDGRSPTVRPLMRARDAIWYNRPDELVALLDDCVDANAPDPSGSTLLHAAVDRDRIDAAKILLAHGARQSAMDATGKTAASYAHSPEMKALLGPAPAVSAPDGNGAPGTASNKTECQQKWRADQALASDATGKAIAYRKWQQCLKTGRYW